MIKKILLILIIPMLTYSGDFLTQQRRYERFRLSEKEKLQSIQELFGKKGLKLTESKVFIRVFKKEAILQLWASTRAVNRFSPIKEYEICASSGDLGPKRMQGDYQVPEGLYHINRFNPVSSFYLSLGVNYPNESDVILGRKGYLGGDIFIHGDCVTIGCIPITDEFIKELYLVCVYARDGGQKQINVHIFPSTLDDSGMLSLCKNNRMRDNVDFRQNLRQFYLYFEENRKVPVFSIAHDGKYVLKR